MFGAHCSIAGGLTNALDDAERKKMDCVQIFTKNQRQWKTKPLTDEEVKQWCERVEELGWTDRVVSHNSYLINMASADPEIRKKSITLQRIELQRCEQLGIAYCVAHPGSHGAGNRKPGDRNDLDSDPTSEEMAGLERIAQALDQIHRDLPGYTTQTCLETTVGAGSHLGYSFHHLAWLRENVREPDRIGYCFDTCHVTAAGYDMSTKSRAETILKQWDDICGARYLRVFHINDSQGKVGSRKDRHAHIGQGTCGMSCFRTIVNHPSYRHVPKVLETPKNTDENGVEWDVVNIRRLRRLVKKPINAGDADEGEGRDDG